MQHPRDLSEGQRLGLALAIALAGNPPILLLDEVVAHLDPSRRAALYDALARLDAQVWMTGADPAAFADIAGRADVFTVAGGKVSRRA